MFASGPPCVQSPACFWLCQQHPESGGSEHVEFPHSTSTVPPLDDEDDALDDDELDDDELDDVEPSPPPLLLELDPDEELPLAPPPLDDALDEFEPSDP